MAEQRRRIEELYRAAPELCPYRETGSQRQLTGLNPGSLLRDFDVSPDGTHIVFDRVAENSDVVLIDLPGPDQ